jgi:hypothetical protein
MDATYIIWWSEHILRGFLLILLLSRRQYARFPAFAVYLASVFAAGLVRMHFYSQDMRLYTVVYYYSQFLVAALGCAVLWELYKHALERYPGTLTIAKTAVSSLFVGALLLALFNAFAGEASGLVRSVIALERNIRGLQAVLLAALLGLIWYYAIPLGRALRGLLVGYGFYIWVNVVTLTLRSEFGLSFQSWWQYLQQTSYVIALLIWIHGVWGQAPEPAAQTATAAADDYRTTAERSYEALSRARRSIFRLLQG